MKKIGIMMAAAVLTAVGFSSCQESAEKLDKDVAMKIELKDSLSQEDYSRMIHYVGEYAEKAQKYVDMEINDNYNAEAKAGMNELNSQFPLVDTFRKCLSETSTGALSEENLKEVAKYVSYTEFTAPSGYTLLTNPDAAGLEVATPDSVNGVIAGAVDTVKVVK